MRADDLSRCLVGVGTAVAGTSLLMTVINAATVLVPDATAQPAAEPLTVLLPMRDEIDNAADCLATVVAAVAHWPGDARIIVLDDGSTDGTSAVLAEAARTHDIEICTGTPPPAGWLGKPWACAQLAEHAPGDGVLVFVDADVRLAPYAFTATVTAMRTAQLDLFCPYPRQVAHGAAERLVQPLLQWSWMATLPLPLAYRSTRPSMAAANGQFLAVDAGRYHAAGGHAAAPGAVLDDIALLRTVMAIGGHGGVGEGSRLATCRMYHGANQVRAGYRKSLWSAFGSPTGAAAVIAVLSLGYVVPAVAALIGSRIGLLGVAAGVGGRVIAAARTGGRRWPDPLAHPVSILAFAALTVDSLAARRRGTLRWKGRHLGAGDE